MTQKWSAQRGLQNATYFVAVEIVFHLLQARLAGDEPNIAHLKPCNSNRKLTSKSGKIRKVQTYKARTLDAPKRCIKMHACRQGESDKWLEWKNGWCNKVDQRDGAEKNTRRVDDDAKK
jgi:hypothetical protein